MNNNPFNKKTPDTGGNREAIDAAVRRATPAVRLAVPSHRRVMRAMGLYANVFVLLVALGLPNGVLRQATGDAVASFDGAVRRASSGVMKAVAAAPMLTPTVAPIEAELPLVATELTLPDDAGVPDLEPTAPVESPPAPAAVPTRSPELSAAPGAEPTMSPSAFPTFQVSEPDTGL